MDGAANDARAVPPAEFDDAWFREMAERMGAVFFAVRIHPDLAFEFISESVYDHTGYTADEVLADPLIFGAELDPRLLPEVTAPDADTVAGSGEFRYEMRIRGRDGRRLSAMTTARRRTRPDGSVVLEGSTLDFTELRQAQHDYESRDKRLAALTESMKDVFWILDTETLRFLYMSPSVELLRGYTVDEIMAQTMDAALTPEASEHIHRDMNEKKAQLRAGDLDFDTFYVEEIEQPRKDGSTVMTEVVGKYHLNEETGHIEVWAITRDVSERVAAREQLAASEERYRLLAENSSDFILLASPEGAIEWISPSVGKVLGFNADDLVGLHVTDYVLPQEDAAVREAQEAAMRGMPATMRVRLPTAGGDLRWFTVSVRPVTDDEGNVIARVSTFSDCQAEVEAEEALAASEQLYRLLAENSMDVIVHIRRGEIAWISPSLRDALGWAPEEWIGATVDSFVHPDDADVFASNRVTLYDGHPVISRYRVRSQDHGYRWIEAHAKPYLDAEGRQDGVVASFRTIDQEVHAEEELLRRARFDDLTGALKRDEVLARLADIGSQRRRAGDECGVLFLDVDGLKEINDTLGHAAGDAVLTTLTARIRDSVRAGDIVARMGGDEFLVILNDIHGVADAEAVAEKIRIASSGSMERLGASAKVSVSIGVTLSNPIESADDIIARADVAMYRAKQSGRDRVVTLLTRTS